MDCLQVSIEWIEGWTNGNNESLFSDIFSRLLQLALTEFFLADKAIQPQVYERGSHPLPTAVSAATLNTNGDLPPKQVFMVLCSRM